MVPLFLLVLLTACAPAVEPIPATTEPTAAAILPTAAETLAPATEGTTVPEITEPSLPAPITPPEDAPLVIDAYSAYFEFSIEEESVLACWYRIPQVVSSGMEEINACFGERYYPYLAYCQKRAESGGGCPTVFRVGYTWGSWEELVSIVVGTYFSEYASYEVYTISLSQAALVDSEKCLDAFGLTEEQFRELVREKAGERYLELRRDMPGFDVTKSPYLEEYTETISDALVNQAIPYIGPNGDLCAVITVHSTIGAPYPQLVITVTGSDLPPNPLDAPQSAP